MQAEPGNLVTMIHHLRTLVTQMKPQNDMTFGEFCVLSMIEKFSIEKGQMLTPTSLNELLGTKKPATSRMLTVLEKKGFLTKNVDLKDHRICYLELTEEGLLRVHEECDIFDRLMKRISDKMGQDEILQIENSLQKLSSILEQEVEELQLNI